MGTFAGSDAATPLKSVLETDREATISIRGVEHHLAYDLAQITPRLRQRLKKISDGDKTDSEETLVEYIAQVVTGWDLTDKAGEPIPLTVDGVSRIAYPALNDIADAINGNGGGASDSPNAAGGATRKKTKSPAESPASSEA